METCAREAAERRMKVLTTVTCVASQVTLGRGAAAKIKNSLCKTKTK